MKLAIIGSRGIESLDLNKYIPDGTDEIVSGGAKGVDTIARKYALSHSLRLKEFLPDYESFGRRAPLLRNLEIIDYADSILAFWDGHSRGTAFVIENARKKGKPIEVILLGEQEQLSLFDKSNS